MPSPQALSPVLRSLVRDVEGMLGEVIEEAGGRPLFESVEAVRRLMLRVRDGSGEDGALALADAQARLRELPGEEKIALARAYTIYLELINQCENAYRTHRLRSRRRDDEHEGRPAETRARAVFVLTAHPTESRSPDNIRLMRRIRDLCVDALERGGSPDRDRIKHLLHLVWRTGSHPATKPTVEDEARHLFSLLSDPILDELIRLHHEGHVVFLRTWVGGDKDGHPGVGPEETDHSLNLSRSRLLGFVRESLLPEVEADLALIRSDELRRCWRELDTELLGLDRVSIGDGRRIERLGARLQELDSTYAAARGARHPRLLDLTCLLRLFPGLVVPLELREERGRFQAGTAIAEMLHYVRDVARGGRVDWYARGLVVSMADRPADLLEAVGLVRDVMGEPSVPVIPLFELPAVLPRAVGILDQTLADPAFRQQVDEWRLEVMLGYSDTSKRMGMLASRLAIHDAMAAVSAWAEQRGVAVIFFHGSGGSVGRGGGTIEEQFATWPADATRLVKQTLQGEMVERTLATPEILRRQVEKIADNQAAPPAHREPGRLARRLAGLSQQAFVETASAPELHELLAQATPYSRLGELNIGSRPASRGKGGGGLESLRAIPWVLCWTQTRYLLHAWLGIGAAWRQLRDRPEALAELADAVRDDPLLHGYLRQLGFTMAKTEPRVFREYVRDLEPARPDLLAGLEAEREAALDLARRADPGGELLSDRQWLRESIHYRAPMIHPLNLLQVEALRQETLSEAQSRLFRETVTGIAAGMLTTG